MAILGWLTPVLGAIFHNAGAILVALHAISLYERNLNPNLTQEKITITRVAEAHCCAGHCGHGHGHEHEHDHGHAHEATGDA